HHGLESLARSWRYEGVLAARDNQYSTINVRARCESSCWDTSTEFKIKPRPPLGGHHGGSADTCSATGHRPLDVQVCVLHTRRSDWLPLRHLLRNAPPPIGQAR